MKKVAIYARVSTDKQTCENQLIELRAVAERGGYTIVTEFVDSGISGAKGRADRPALDAMMKAASQRKFDLILVWSIDRLGRSLQNLVELAFPQFTRHFSWRSLTLPLELMGTELIEVLMAPNTIVETLDVIEDF